ncbi:MAG: hypothetical protein ACRDTS_13040 [Mycobacterium sp.]
MSNSLFPRFISATSTPEPAVVLTCTSAACQHTYEPDSDYYTDGRPDCPLCGSGTVQAQLTEPCPDGRPQCRTDGGRLVPDGGRPSAPVPDGGRTVSAAADEDDIVYIVMPVCTDVLGRVVPLGDLMANSDTAELLEFVRGPEPTAAAPMPPFQRTSIPGFVDFGC